jgi:hypothetical protein
MELLGSDSQNFHTQDDKKEEKKIAHTINLVSLFFIHSAMISVHRQQSSANVHAHTTQKRV